MSINKDQVSIVVIEIIKWYTITLLGFQVWLIVNFLKRIAPLFEKYIYPNIKVQELIYLLVAQTILICLLLIACFFLYKFAKQKQKIIYQDNKPYIQT